MSKKTTPKYYTQRIILEEKVEDGLVKLKDGRWITIVEIYPLNFHTKELGAKQSIIATFHSWLKICPRKWQLKIVTRVASATDHTKLVKERLNVEKSVDALRIGADYINHVESFTKRNGLDKRFFFILSDDGLTDHARTEEERKKNLIYEANQIRLIFGAMGHDMPIYSSKEQSNLAMQEILYTFYNPKSSDYITLEDRQQKVASDFQLRNPSYEGIDIPLPYIIGPRNIEFQKKDYIVIDGVYRTYFYIPSDHYPVWIYDMAWLSLFKNMEGFNIDLFVEQKNDHVINLNIKERMVDRSISSSQRDSRKANKTRVNMEKKDTISFFRKAMSNDERIFDMVILISVEDRTLNGLQNKVKDIKRSLTIKQVNKIIPLWYGEDLGLFSSCFANKVDVAIQRKATQNITSQSVANLYPLTAYKIHEPNGIFLGADPLHSTPITIDVFDKNLDNANLAILGATGKGKTMTVCVLAERYRIMGVPMYIITPKKSHEYIPLASIYPNDSSYITISDGSEDCINLMEIRPLNDEMERLLSGDLFKPQSRLTAKIDALEIVFELMYPSASETKKQLFNNCCMETYAKFGITKDNDSLFLNKENNILKPMPILGDLVDTINEAVRESDSQDAKDIATVLSRFTTGSSQVFNGQTNVNLEASIVIINVEQLSDKLKPLGMFIATDVLKGVLEKNRAAKKMLIIDEFSFLIGKSADKRTANHIATWAKLIRGLGGSLVLASQELDDLDTDVGRVVLNACESMLILGLKAEQARKIQELLGLSDSQRQAITTFTRGQGLLIRNGSVSNVNVLISKREEMTFTTKRDHLEKKLEEIKKAKGIEYGKQQS